MTSLICSGVPHFTCSSAGLATTTAKHFAREVATFSRFLSYKNSMFRGRYSPLEVAIEISMASDEEFERSAGALAKAFARVGAAEGEALVAEAVKAARRKPRRR